MSNQPRIGEGPIIYWCPRPRLQLPQYAEAIRRHLGFSASIRHWKDEYGDDRFSIAVFDEPLSQFMMERLSQQDLIEKDHMPGPMEGLQQNQFNQWLRDRRPILREWGARLAHHFPENLWKKSKFRRLKLKIIVLVIRGAIRFRTPTYVILPPARKPSAPLVVTPLQKAPPTLNGTALIINAGDHLELDKYKTQGSILLPYKHIKILGHGGSASVEMVQDINSGQVFARKIIRNVYSRNIVEAKRLLRNEVQVMKRLASNHHIVNVHATYIMKRELALILTPVADGGDLATFLQEYRDSEDPYAVSSLHQNPVIWNAFGCLASGLAFIHQQTIRHKDIKPQNILIHQNSVLYSDFGLSYDFGDAGQSTTTGPVYGLTQRYCAPEVAAGESRNSKSDVFSLGCVYIEMYAALYPDHISEELLVGPFHQKIKNSQGQGWRLKLPIGDPQYMIDFVMRAMVQLPSDQRLPAAQIAELLAHGERDSKILFCGRCLETRKSDNAIVENAQIDNDAPSHRTCNVQ